MAPSAVESCTQASEAQNAIQPPHLYTPRELHFEKFLDVQADGYQKAVSRGPGRAAIVIDNGSPPLLCPWPQIDGIRLHELNRLISYSSWLVVRRCAATEPHAHLLEIQRQEVGQDVLFRRS